MKYNISRERFTAFFILCDIELDSDCLERETSPISIILYLLLSVRNAERMTSQEIFIHVLEVLIVEMSNETESFQN